MLYLTSFDIVERPRIRYQLDHLGAYHNLVEHLFTYDFESKNRKRHLWRLDGNNHLTILSDSKPSSSYLHRVACNVHINRLDNFIDQLADGQTYDFTLKANPVKGHTRGHLAVRNRASQLAWLNERSQANGFELKSIGVSQVEHPLLKRGRHKKGRSFHMLVVTYAGTLKICDLAAFKRTLLTGLGREKAFGNGLLSLSLPDEEAQAIA